MLYKEPFKPRKSLFYGIFKQLKKKSVLAVILVLFLNLLAANLVFGCHVNLSIDKTDSPDPVQPGQEITYSISYTVEAVGYDATNVIITDQLPSEVSFVSASVPGVESSGIVTWQLGNVSSNNTKNGTVTLVVKVNQGVADGTVIANTAVIDTDQTSPKDSTTDTTVFVPSFCGDGAKQSPNQVGTGGPLNDGYEDCDGTDGVGAHQECNSQCILQDLTFCGDGTIQNPNDDGFAEQCEVNTDCGDQNPYTVDVCDLCLCEHHDQTFCGDGAKQSPNQVGTGGPLNDGYEDCDGTDGVGAHQQCTSQCVLENLTFCGDGTVQKPNDDGFDEQCDGQAGVGEHQQCTDQCILIDLTYCGDGNIQTPNDDGFDEQCEVDTDCNDENSNTTDVCNLCTCEFHGQTFCGDGIKQSPNEEGSGGPQNDGYEGCDGADGVGAHQQCTSQCVLENLPYCGDGTVDPGEACDDGNNTSGDGCSASCKNEGCVGYCGGGKVTYDPRLLMNKTVDHVFVYPNQEIIYTLEITNIGNEVGENLTVTDSLPEGFTYATTSETIVVWDLGNIASYETKKISYPVKVGAGVLPGIYENNALAKITNVGPPDNVAYGSVEVEVREPTEADFPILSLEKSHEAPYAKAGDEVAYLLKVSNSGEGTAYEVKLNDVLPADFITKGGITEWVIGDIGPGEIKTVEYVVIVGNDVSPGEYQNTVTLSSTNHDDLEASAVLKIIFEELPDTGNGKQMIIYFLGGLFVICSSAYVYFDSKKYISSNI